MCVCVFVGILKASCSRIQAVKLYDRVSYLHKVHADGDHVVTGVRVDVRLRMSVLALVVTPRTLRSLVLTAYLLLKRG